jgi:predicted Rossmann fold flavoprotein
VPSLFTFNIRDPRIAGLSGLSVPKVSIQVLGEKSLTTSGALLVTHWGLSAQSILRLSAWGARRLNELGYQFTISINWACDYTRTEVIEQLKTAKQEQPRRQVDNSAQFGLPSRLWQRLCVTADIGETQTWATLTKQQMQALQEQITDCELLVQGKSTFKEEFVTAGGVSLDEVDFTRFESRLFPNLYFAGEILDIDAITGGFNFQAAWTGGYHVGTAVAAALSAAP